MFAHMTKSLVSFLVLCWSLSILALPPETQLNYKGSLFSHFVSHDLSKTNSQIEKVIITIHGSERNSHTYYNSVEAMAKREGVAEKTIIISPHFKEAQDTLVPDELYFSPEGWLSGDQALNQHAISSFEVLDHLISKLGDVKVFPNLKNIVITGHSAGGQLTQRYAAGSAIEKKFPTIHFRYIVANPGSYLYLTANRPVKASGRCNFNDYKYGLDRLNPYMQKNAANIRNQYASKEVVYFLGEQDIISGNIDQSCPAQYQGKNRLERGQLYKAQLEKEFPAAKHYLYSVPGVGHTQFGMYTSPVGQKVLFQKF
jgi:uncharacterized alpha/beta hydrolase family protein